MKKLIFVFFLFFSLTACSTSDVQTESVRFESKVSCSKFVDDAKNRISIVYYGTFYSKKLDTCISVYYANRLFEDNDSARFYYDELTGSRPKDLTEADPENYEWYDGLPVVRKGESEYESYEFFLDFYK